MNILWLPFSIIGRNLFGVIILIAIIVFFVVLKDDESSIQQQDFAIPSDSVQSQSAATVRIAPTPPPQTKGAPPVVIEPVRKIENGNSSFAQDLLKLMTDEERAYYSQMFYWTMNNTPSGKSSHWSNGNTFGSITPQAIFLNKRGYACRNFSEVLKVRDIKQNIRGISCQRGGGAWCKLGPNATPGCGLGQASSMWQDIKRSIGL